MKRTQWEERRLLALLRRIKLDSRAISHEDGNNFDALSFDELDIMFKGADDSYRHQIDDSSMKEDDKNDNNDSNNDNNES